MLAYALTDSGKVRKTNQDYIFFSQEPVGILDNLLLLADGMGGQRAGDFASRYVVENLLEYLETEEKEPEGSVTEYLKHGIINVNAQLYMEAEQKEELQGTGTTLVVATTKDHILYVANIGDSRLYLLRDNMEQVTKDHSYVEEMVAMGRMTRGSRDYQSKKNIITRAMGASSMVSVDIFTRKVQPGDVLLLCSDGLTNMVDEMEIEYIIRSEGDLKKKAENLVAAANRNGGKDNISVILALPEKEGDSLRSPAAGSSEVEVC